MKTITINLYSFEELSEEAKQKAIEELSDINTDYNWWESTYEDAAIILLKITSFDIDRKEIEVRPVHGHTVNCIVNSILKNHCTDCNTYQLAENSSKLSYEGFLKALSIEYLKMLTEDYAYRTSNPIIMESIIANEYDFTESGKFFYESLIK